MWVGQTTTATPYSNHHTQRRNSCPPQNASLCTPLDRPPQIITDYKKSFCLPPQGSTHENPHQSGPGSNRVGTILRDRNKVIGHGTPEWATFSSDAWQNSASHEFPHRFFQLNGWGAFSPSQRAPHWTNTSPVLEMSKPHRGHQMSRSFGLPHRQKNPNTRKNATSRQDRYSTEQQHVAERGGRGC